MLDNDAKILPRSRSLMNEVHVKIRICQLQSTKSVTCTMRICLCEHLLTMKNKFLKNVIPHKYGTTVTTVGEI